MFAAEKCAFKIERFLNELHTHWNKIKFTPMQYLTRKKLFVFLKNEQRNIFFS